MTINYDEKARFRFTKDQILQAYINAVLILIKAEDSGEEPKDDSAAIKMTKEYEEETVIHNAELARHELRMNEIESNYWDSVILRAARVLERRNQS